MISYARFALGANLLALGAFVPLAAIALFDPPRFAAMAAKDHGGHWPLFETLTPIVLLPGIAAGCYALARHRRMLPARWLQAWLLGWILACVYFAGEELSWGQWIFGWQTPETLRALNVQGETNLHNLSPWLDKKPRSLVELFILAAGLVLPLWLRARGVRADPARWWHWVLGPGRRRGVRCVAVLQVVRAAGVRGARRQRVPRALDRTLPFHLPGGMRAAPRRAGPAARHRYLLGLVFISRRSWRRT